MNEYLDFRRTRATMDQDAIELNSLLNDVLHRASIGQKLKALFCTRFGGHPQAFRRWINEHLDTSTQSAARYMSLGEHFELLQESGIVDLVSAYKLLDINGVIPATDSIWGVGEEVPA